MIFGDFFGGVYLVFWKEKNPQKKPGNLSQNILFSKEFIAKWRKFGTKNKKNHKEKKNQCFAVI
jgi:hypothetical protein